MVVVFSSAENWMLDVYELTKDWSGGWALTFGVGSRAGIQAAHASRLARQLSALDAATRSEDMNRPGWDWHPLKGELSGHWSVSVSGNWRLTFAFDGGDAVLVDYQDYH